MTLKSILENFQNAVPAVPKSEPISDTVEAARSEGYERGYTSGWEDASKAAEDSRQKIDAEFARNIQDLSFTFHEATNHVRGEVLDLLDHMMSSFFPEILPQVLRETVRQSVFAAMDEALDAEIHVVAAPDGVPFLSGLLEGENGLPITLKEEPTLAPHQVFIRFADREVDLNFSAVLDAFSTQLKALNAEKDIEAHGRNG